MEKAPYREAIGSLMYASVATRPEISFAVTTLSQFLDMPSQAMPSSLTAAWYLGVLENKNLLLFPQLRQNMLQRCTQPRKPYGFDDFFSNFSLPLKHPPFSFVTTKPCSGSLKTTIIERGPSTSTSAIILFIKSH